MHADLDSTVDEKDQPPAAEPLPQRASRAVLPVLFLGAFANALLAPFMGYFIVEGKGLAPWWLSVYSAVAITVSIAVNRYIGRRIDRGTRLYQWLLLGQAAYAIAVALLIYSPPAALLIGLVGIFQGIPNTATTTMYSFGRLMLDDTQDRAKINSKLRVITSLAWMLAPPLTFSLASWNTGITVFQVAAGVAMGWILVGRLVLPTTFRSPPAKASAAADGGASGFGMLRRTAVCFFFAPAHVLCSTSLPLYYTRELDLAPYAAGLSFGVKCAVEVAAILLAPWLVKKLGTNRGLFISALFAFAAFSQFLNASSLTGVLLGACLEGMFYGTFAAVAMTYVQEMSPTRVGRATSAYMNSLFLGGMAGILMLGAVATAYDFRAVIVGALIAMATGSAILLADTLSGARQENRARPLNR